MQYPNAVDDDALPHALKQAAARFKAILEQNRSRYSEASQESSALTEISSALEVINNAHDQLISRGRMLNETSSALRMERARYEHLFSLLSDAYVITDAHATIIECNDIAEWMLGAGTDRLRGKPLALYVSADDRDAFRAHLAELVGNEWQMIEMSCMMVPRSGNPVRVAVRASCISDDSGRKQYGWLIRDTTEKVRADTLGLRYAEEQNARIGAERSSRRFRLLAEASRQLNTTTDIDALCQSVARAVVKYGSDHCEILLLEDERLISRARANREPRQAAFMEALRRRHVLSADDPGSLVWQALRTGVVQTAPAASADGTHGYKDVYAAVREGGPRNALALPLTIGERTLGVMVVMNAEPTPTIGVEDVGVFFEIAMRASMALANAALMQELQRANAEKAEFLEVLSHELRTPLTAVIGYSELLLASVPDALPERARDKVDRIRNCSWHQLGVIEQILHYARVDSGIQAPVIAEVDINELIRDAVGIVQAAVPRKDVGITVDLPDAKLHLRTDAGRLRQIVVNLLTNAFKFTDHGAVSVSVRGDDEHYYVTVADTGIGIDIEEMPRIFEPFWRGNNSGTHTRVGTGLGLAVSARLAKSIGADLSVQSRVGIGTIFTLRLPLR